MEDLECFSSTAGKRQAWGCRGRLRGSPCSPPHSQLLAGSRARGLHVPHQYENTGKMLLLT